MYRMGGILNLSVPEADDCWECWSTMNMIHGGICPGLRVDGVKLYSPNAVREGVGDVD